MKLKLEKIQIINFKGVSELEVEFGDLTEIRGKNKTGKTTLMDAYLWLLFGKDSSDRTEFNIKPLNEDGSQRNRQENIVEAVLNIDGKSTSLKKIHKEKWQKRKGESETRFTGNETKYWIDDVPQSSTQYNKFIHSLMDEGVFKLISSTRYFHTLNWRDRRNILFSISGGIDESEILQNLQQTTDKEKAERFKKLEEYLSSNKTIDDFKKSVNEKKKKLERELKDIPPRIEELKRGMPEQKDFTEIEKQLADKKKEIESVNSQIADKRKGGEELQKKIQANYQKIYELENKIDEKKRNQTKELRENLQKIETKISELETKESDYRREKQRLENRVENIRESIQEEKTQIEETRKKWFSMKESTLNFEDTEFVCPLCLGSGKVTGDEELKIDDTFKGQKDEAIKQFNKEKSEKLEELNNYGVNLKKEIEELEFELVEKDQKIKEIEKAIEETTNEKKTKQERKTYFENSIKEAENFNVEKMAPNETNEIKQLKEENQSVKFPDDKQLQSKLEQLNTEKDKLRDQLKEKDSIKKTNERIKELENEEKDYSQQLADLEKQEFTANEFIKTKVNTLESKLNKMFDFVKFKMFDILINGAEVETCDTLINGVPYEDANNGSKILAGLDIIKTLSKIYDVFAPIFIDNREAITDFRFDLVTSQLISLIVDDNYDKLSIKNFNNVEPKNS